MKNIDKLKRQLASLEFELRYESDRQEMDNIANERDAVARRIASMDCDGPDEDGKPILVNRTVSQYAETISLDIRRCRLDPMAAETNDIRSWPRT